MKRIVLGAVAVFGGIMIFIAGAMLVDQAISEEERAEIRGSMSDAVTRFAEDDQSGLRPVRRIKHAINGLMGGMFFETTFDVAQLFPPAPEGWARQPYTEADGHAVTGRFKSTGIAVQINDVTDSWLREISAAALAEPFSRSVTYSNGTHHIVIWGVSALDHFRTLERGTPAEVAGLLSPPDWTQTAPAWRVQGIAFQAKHPMLQRRDIQDAPKDFLYYAYRIGGVVKGGVLSNLTEAEVQAFLGGMDIAGVQALLPRPTRDYVPALGLETADRPERQDPFSLADG